MGQFILALDLGTTGNRAILFNKEGKIEASSYYEFPQHFPKPGWVEHDANDIWNTTKKALDDVLNVSTDIAAIGITNQRETTVVWDSETGEPIHNAIVWQCRRTAERCHDLSEHHDMIRSKTGLLCDAYFSATKLEWLLNNVPGAQQKAKEGRLKFGTIDSWIIWKLTGGSTHITDASNASRTMLYNIHTGQYDPDLLTLFNIPETMLPRVCDSSGVAAHTDTATIGHRFPIAGIIGDQQGALFTQCGHDTTRIKNTYGTGLFIVANTGNTALNIDGLITTVAWQQQGKITYALEGSIFVGGSAIQWLRDGLGLFKEAKETEAMATSLTSNDDVYFVPALVGLGAPHWDSDARGLFSGLTRGTTRNHMVRAALEALAYQTADVLNLIRSHLTVSSLRVDGGAVNNSFLMQFQSDILDLPVEKPRITETTAFGAAGMAAIATGFWSEATFSSLNQIETTLSPTMRHDERSHLLNGWHDAVQRTLLKPLPESSTS